MRVFVCQALKPFLQLMQGKIPGSPFPSPGEICHATLDSGAFGIGKAICSLIEDLIAIPIALAVGPAALAAFATAWEAAQAYDDLFVTGPVSKRIEVGDTVIVSGRWTWDAGHAGHTEFHPVKTFQRMELRPGLRGGHDPRNALAGADSDDIKDLHARWCRHVLEAPPPPDPTGHGRLTGAQLDALTPQQLEGPLPPSNAPSTAGRSIRRSTAASPRATAASRIRSADRSKRLDVKFRRAG